MQFWSSPIRAVLFVTHHDRAQSAATFQLDRIAMRIMPNGQSFARDESGVEWKRDRWRPLHRVAGATEARLAVLADRVMAATFFDRPFSILQGFFLTIPGIDLR